MEKLNSSLNERIGSLLQEIRTLRNVCELRPFFLSQYFNYFCGSFDSDPGFLLYPNLDPDSDFNVRKMVKMYYKFFAMKTAI